MKKILKVSDSLNLKIAKCSMLALYHVFHLPTLIHLHRTFILIVFQNSFYPSADNILYFPFM